MSKIMEYISWFFNDIATVPRLAIALSMLFALVVVLLFVNNFAFSALAKVRKANARANKFFKKHTAIDYYNILAFYKKCIACMPKGVRKAWKKYEISCKPIQNSTFELTLRESVAKGGAVGFGIYLYLYIAVMAVLVVAMMVSDMPQEVSSIYVCVCLIAGAVGLFVIGMQLYFMDKKATVRLDSFIRSIYSNNKVFNNNLAKGIGVAQSVATPIVKNAAKVEQLQPTYSNLDRVNQINNLTGTIQESDSISKLNTLVDEIIAKGDNQEFLECVHNALLAVYDAKFSKPLDELRIKCIIKKLGIAQSNQAEVSENIVGKHVI